MISVFNGRGGCFLVGASAAAIAIATPAQAQDRQFDIPAQSLSAALMEFSRQSDVLVIMAPELTEGKRSRALRGMMPVNVALARLLAGSNLRAVPNPRGGYRIELRDGPSTSAAARPDEVMEGRFNDGASVTIAESYQQEIVVTGSNIRGAAPAGANLIVMDRGKLEETGRGSLAEAIQTLPQTHGAGANDATYWSGGSKYSGAGAAGASSINLRGLGVEETLTLVNGHRLAPAGGFGSFADISVIPFVAVQRVEVLADGASATYGADAMAGVVNIILDDRFQGAEARLRTGIETRSGKPEMHASQAIGWASDQVSALFAGEYVFRDRITGAGRPYFKSDLREFGGSDNRTTDCSPGNILSPDELSGAIPPNQDGRSLASDQILRGQINLCDRRDGADIAPLQERANLFGSLLYRLSDRMRMNAYAMGSFGRTDVLSGYSFYPIPLLVPVSNAYRQLNGFTESAEPMEVSYLFTEAGPDRASSKTWSINMNLGLEYELPGGWLTSLTSGYGRYQNVNHISIIDTRPIEEGGALMSALASSDLATALNPFGHAANDPRLVASFFVPHKIKRENDVTSVGLKIDGPLLQIPAGPIRAAAGFDIRSETIKSLSGYQYPGVAEHDLDRDGGSRSVIAGFAELYLPIFSRLNAKPGLQQLSASVAGRFDHYSDFGSTFNPKLGLTWSPLAGVSFKGTVGTSFKAPLLADLFGSRNVLFIPFPRMGSAPDPNGDGRTNLLLVSGAASDLKPERGKTWTIGMELAPVAVPRLTLQLGYFDLKFKDRFGGIDLFAAPFFEPDAYLGINYFPEPTPGLVDSLVASADTVLGARMPVEAIIIARTMNFTTQSVQGLDGHAGYVWDGLGGNFSLELGASYFHRYRSRLGASVKETSMVGDVGLPARWRGRGGIGWAGNGLSVNAAANYTASYWNKLTSQPQPVRSQLTFDLSLRADQDAIGHGLSLALYATNIFDRAPPFVDNPQFLGYDGANADPIGRRIVFQMTKRW